MCAPCGGQGKGADENAGADDRQGDRRRITTVRRAQRGEGRALEAQLHVVARQPERITLAAEVLERVQAGSRLRDEQRHQRQQHDRLFRVVEQHGHPGSVAES